MRLDDGPDTDAPRLYRGNVRLYLHEGRALGAAVAFWSEVTAVPPTQFRTPYRAVADTSIRTARHPMGVASVIYASSQTHRSVMGLMAGLLTSESIPDQADHPNNPATSLN